MWRVTAELVRVERMHSRPESDVRVVRNRRLQPHQVLDDVDRPRFDALEQELPREQCPVQRPPIEHAPFPRTLGGGHARI